MRKLPRVPDTIRFSDSFVRDGNDVKTPGDCKLFKLVFYEFIIHITAASPIYNDIVQLKHSPSKCNNYNTSSKL